MRNHLFIGLGGQGGRTLAELRKVMEQRGRDAKKLEAANMRWQFLAIDSSSDVRNELKCWKYFGRDLSLSQNDWLELAPVSSTDVDVLAIRPDVAPWIGNRQQIKDFIENSKIEGANQRRRFGRLLFAHNADRIRTALFNQKVPSLVASAHNQCVFHIFASLAGGTGSGCIVDLIATIRAKFPESDLNAFPIFVYVYATHDDGSDADVGYFYQNQFATLRDLNALICDKSAPQFSLDLLGTQVAGAHYNGSEPIAQLVTTTSLNQHNVTVSLPNQIRTVAESCFERIFAWGTGQMGANTQRSITGQDIVAGFPGEPLRNPERSYRFAGFGMRRWEVPHQKIAELLALDLLSSALRQMLYANWEHNRGFADTLPPLSSSVSAPALASLDRIVERFLISHDRVGDFVRELRNGAKDLTSGILKENRSELDLGILESRIKAFYERSFQGTGSLTLFQTLQRNQNAEVDEAVVAVDQALTSLWLDAANPVALGHISDLLEALFTTLRAKLENRLDLSKTEQHLVKVSAARRQEWAKLTILSSMVGKRESLFRAHAKDAVALHEMDIQRQSEELDAEFLRNLLARLTQLKVGYASARGEFNQFLKETEQEQGEIFEDLQAMQSREGANKYEFDAKALRTFLAAMQSHKVHQRDSATALRMKVYDLLNGRPLTALREKKLDFKHRALEEMRETAMERAKAVHQSLEQSGEAPRILDESLLTILQTRLNGSERALADEVSAFVARAASCLHLRGGTQPATLLGKQVGVPSMPKRVLLLGLPNDNPAFTDQLRSAFERARNAGTNLICDTYTHDDPTQLRLLFVDYWLAARLTTVAHELAGKYAEVTEGEASGDTAYFCNIDSAGEKGMRPPLFLPTPEEMRNRYEAELWLGSLTEIDVVRVDQNGVSLIREGREDASEVVTLGPTLERVRDTADEESMHVVHETLRDAVLNLKGDRRHIVAELIRKETEQITNTHGKTSPEYRRWMKLRTHLQGFTN